MISTIASLWIGDELGDIELASIRSFQKHGHKFFLYAYGPIIGVPKSVEILDANTIFQSSKVIRHLKNGSPAIHSDLFRYALMMKTNHIWVDLDIIALRQFSFPSEYVFGYENGDTVSNAVLRLPRSSTSLELLLALEEGTTGIPPQFVGVRKFKYSIKSALSGGLTIDRWPWGATGPGYLTWALQEAGEISNALPVDSFYSVPFAEAWRFCDPGMYSEGDAPKSAYGVHLWANKLRPYVNSRYNSVFPTLSFVKSVANDDT